MRLMLDSNIIIDYLKTREPFCESARMLLLLGRLGEFQLWMSTAQINDIFYISTEGGKLSLAPGIGHSLKKLRRGVRACSLSEAQLDAALDSTWADLEDACVYQCALEIKADAIITRNQKDFEKSSIRVFDCDQFFEYLAKEKGLTYEMIP